MSRRKKKPAVKPSKKEKKSFLLRVRNFFLTTVLGGIALILPLALLILAVNFIWRMIKRVTDPIKRILDLPEDVAVWIVDLSAVGVVLVAFFIIGLFVRTNIGKEFWIYLEQQFLAPLPLYTTIRDTVQQFFGNQDKMPFSEVVLVDVFNNDTRMVGFISDELENGQFSVFVPTGPNPTNGFIFIVTEKQMERLPIRPDEAMRVVVGVGTGAGKLFHSKRNAE